MARPTTNVCIAREPVVSPLVEMGAYEALWDERGATFRRLSERFAEKPGAMPSAFVSNSTAEKYAHRVLERFEDVQLSNYGIRIHGAGEYPCKLRDAKHPIELIYYQGWWDIVNSRSVAVVGTRNPTRDGIARTRRLVKCLVKDDFTIVSGLATGVDREAHLAAIAEGGRTIAVMGTPLHHTYPRENIELRERIANEFLLVTQVPVVRYDNQDYRSNRGFFPERNKTMSALTEATIIVEAGETSGTLIQAKAALEQGRKLFILDSCFKNGSLTWPAKFEEMGAVRVRDYDDIAKALS